MTSRHAKLITSVFQVLGLREGEGAKDTVTNNGAANKLGSKTKVFNVKTKTECSFKSDNKKTITTNEEAVVNINNEGVDEVGNGNSEDGGIDRGLSIKPKEISQNLKREFQARGASRMP
jgi:hypothetical protein